MNKKQFTVAWVFVLIAVAGLFLKKMTMCVDFMDKPGICTNYTVWLGKWMQNDLYKYKVHTILSSVILGGLLIYLLRDKKK